jgi:drug/metabolite transporter (DMT)-like permease
MIFAFVTTVLFSASAVLANRSIRHFGSTKANFFRLVLAAGCLAAVAHLHGLGLRGPAFWWFFLSGCIGFGIGDIALFFAYPRLGSRLTVLMTQCLAAPVAAVAEWIWLGNRVTWSEGLCGVIILAGVAVALAPGKIDHMRRAVLIAGLIAGVVSAAGQGMGAVVSRKAYDVSSSAGVTVDGMTAAYQRILGGLLVTGLSMLALRVRSPGINPASPLLPAVKSGLKGSNPHVCGPHAGDEDSRPGDKKRGLWSRGWPWVVANAMAGPVLGVSCFQWALATTKSGIVLPIIALTPIVVMPFAYFMEGDRPTGRGLLGGAIAVVGAVGLALAAHGGLPALLHALGLGGA